VAGELVAKTIVEIATPTTNRSQHSPSCSEIELLGIWNFTERKSSIGSSQ
jgi:hypothetical protein